MLHHEVFETDFVEIWWSCGLIEFLFRWIGEKNLLLNINLTWPTSAN
jgi:hypothetical protein